MKTTAIETAPAPQSAKTLSPPTAIDSETLELLAAWAREDSTDDPEKRRLAQQELDEFKKAMNENRSATGERIHYP